MRTSETRRLSVNQGEVVMDLDLSEEQEMLRAAAREFLQQESPVSFVRDMEEDERGFTPEIWQKLAQVGWLGLPVPEQYGGTGG